MIESPYLFVLTNTGSEKALKIEVTEQALLWRCSYQRKGFVTFIAPSQTLFSLDATATPLALARRIALSMGKFQSEKDAEEYIKELFLQEDGDNNTPIIHYARWHNGAIRNRENTAEHNANAIHTGSLVATLLQLQENEFWVGVHKHAPLMSQYPAGDSSVQLVAEAPSRAWLKLEEAVRFFNLTFTPEDIAVELGCAPGGITYALLNRHVSVIGIDPASMAETLNPWKVDSRTEIDPQKTWFYHCKKPAALVGKRDLEKGITHFISDMNQSPEVALIECCRLCTMCPTIHTALITLKCINLTDITRKEAWFNTLKSKGFRTIKLQQLSVHHTEFLLFAQK